MCLVKIDMLEYIFLKNNLNISQDMLEHHVLKTSHCRNKKGDFLRQQKKNNQSESAILAFFVFWNTYM